MTTPPGQYNPQKKCSGGEARKPRGERRIPVQEGSIMLVQKENRIKATLTEKETLHQKEGGLQYGTK